MYDLSALKEKLVQEIGELPESRLLEVLDFVEYLLSKEQKARVTEPERDLDPAKAAGFYLQQAVEKFLKAFLLSKGWALERIHDLEALLNAALAYDPSLEQFRAACQKITGFYLVERYPFITEAGLTEDDVRNSLKTDFTGQGDLILGSNFYNRGYGFFPLEERS